MLGKGDYVLILVGEQAGKRALIEGMSSYGKYPVTVEGVSSRDVTPCTYAYFGPDEIEPWRPTRWERLMSEGPLNYRTTSEIRARTAEFEPLTNEPGSDLGRLLTALSRGEDPILRAAVYEEDGKPLGWAVCERFSTRRQTAILLNVFVAPERRSDGKKHNTLASVHP